MKLWSDLLDSSLWIDSPSDIRIVWITLLAMADSDGIVRATDRAIARRAIVDQAEADTALALFSAPDPESRTPDNDGRRIEKVPGGYLILRYVELAGTRTRAEQRDATRKRVAAFRARTGRNATANTANRDGGTTCIPVTRCNAAVTNVTKVTHTDTDADADADADVDAEAAQQNKRSLVPSAKSKFADAWQLYPKRRGGNPRAAATKAWRARVSEGESEDELLLATTNYAAACAAENKTHTQFVLMATTFFGPAARWREYLAAPPSAASPLASGSKPTRAFGSHEWRQQVRDFEASIPVLSTDEEPSA